MPNLDLIASLCACLVLAIPYTVFAGDSEPKFEVQEIYSSSSYLDGGSYFYLVQTTDNRNIYIFIDRAAVGQSESGSEIAYLNSIDLTENPEAYSDVLLAFDLFFRTAFNDIQPFNVDIKRVIEDGDEEALKILMLSALIQDSCRDMISFYPAKFAENVVDCSFYTAEL